MFSAQRTLTMPAVSADPVASSRISISVLVVIAAVIGPLRLFELVGDASYHDKQRILEIFCVVLVTLFSTFVLVRRDKIRLLHDRRSANFLALFFLLGLVSSVVAYSPRHALFECANFLLLIITSLLLASEISAKGDSLLDKILLLCGLGCAIYILIEIIIYVAVINVAGQPSDLIFIFGFDNYRFLNHVQTITLPLLGLFTIRSSDRKKKIFAWIVTSLWWTLLFVSAGRGTFIGILAGLCMAWICLRKDALPWCRIMLLSALAGFGAYLLFYVLIPVLLGLQPFGLLLSVVSRTATNPDSSRLPLWIRAWEILVAHPWLGAGPLHFAHFGRTVQNGAHPHNWVLQIACEWGIPALLCLVAAIVLGFKKLLAVRQYLATADIKNRLTLAAWLTTGVAILVDGLVSGLIVMPTSQLWIALYIGCAWGWVCSLAPAQSVAEVQLSIPGRVGGVLGMLTLLYFLGNGLWPEIQNLPLHEEQALQKTSYGEPMLHPRIWRAGYF
ncbi:O-antigen ligase family protein [Paraherbaspirillum soli]|uniref:O-antigen ligase family protein n=1 Tax=Paraherbaspirillum soli TaxID=631222 RepID=A0ABW0M8Z3_9BURK